MTTEDINAVAEILSRELEAIDTDTPAARSWRRVLISYALEGVHLQTLADVQRSPGVSTGQRR
jgi:hypothetical protein